MSQAFGSKVALGYQAETTFGQLPASIALKKCYFTSESLGLSWNLVSSNVLGGDRNPRKAARGDIDLSGTINTELSPQLGTLIKAALGSNATTGASSPYTHTMKIGDLPSLVIERGYTDIGAYLVYLGCKVNRMTLSIKPSGMQDISFDLMGVVETRALAYDAQSGNFTAGLTVTGGTSSASGKIISDSDSGTTGVLAIYGDSGTFANDEVITDTSTGSASVNGTLGGASIDNSHTDPTHTPFDGFAIATVEEGGSAIANVVSIDGLTIENNLDGGTYVIGGQGRRVSLPEGRTRVSGTLKALFESMTLYNKAIKYQESSLKVIYKLGTGVGTAGNEYLEFFLPELVYSPKSPTAQGPNGILVELPFEAFYENVTYGSNTSAMHVILKNAEATI